MKCNTVRKDFECNFMTAKGCSYKDGVCHPIEEKCSGCSRIAEFNSESFCLASPDPKLKWQLGDCNLATHIKKDQQAGAKKKVNPIKQSKRS